MTEKRISVLSASFDFRVSTKTIYDWLKSGRLDGELIAGRQTVTVNEKYEKELNGTPAQTIKK